MAAAEGYYLRTVESLETIIRAGDWLRPLHSRATVNFFLFLFVIFVEQASKQRVTESQNTRPVVQRVASMAQRDESSSHEVSPRHAL